MIDTALMSIGAHGLILLRIAIHIMAVTVITPVITMIGGAAAAMIPRGNMGEILENTTRR